MLTSAPAESSLADILEEVENKKELVNASAIRLLRQFNYSVPAMKRALQHLSEENGCPVHALQVDMGEMKGRLKEVISSGDALCKRIATEAPELLRSMVKPFAAAAADLDINSGSSSVKTIVK